MNGRYRAFVRCSSVWAVCLVSTTACETRRTGPHGTTEGDSDTAGETDDVVVPSSGFLGCPADTPCTLALVSQTLDDRLDVFSLAPEVAYRGSIDLDLKPNPAGDISGDRLDEPYGIALSSIGLHVLVGHYPTIDEGTLLTFPFERLQDVERGATFGANEYFDGTAFTQDVTGAALGVVEPLFVVRHPSDRLLIAVFNNDLQVPATMWTMPGQLIVFDPHAGEFATRSLADIDAVACTGAWSLVPLDDRIDTVAVACDGNEGVAILDVSAVGRGAVGDAAARITGCVADLQFPDKRVRFVAADGHGGVLVAETPSLATGEDGRLWRFDRECTPVSIGTLAGSMFWDVREIVSLPASVPTWLLANGGPNRGVYVAIDQGDGPEICGRLPLAEMLTSQLGEDLDPHALAWSAASNHLVVTASPASYLEDGPGAGKVWSLELGDPDQACADPTAGAAVELTALAPALVSDVPATWRRAPNVAVVHSQG